MKKVTLFIVSIVFVLALSACKGELTFELIGEDTIDLHVNDAYLEKGFFAKDNSTDISQYVTFEGNVNPYEAGDYTVTYTLDYNGETQTLSRLVRYRDTGCQAIEDTNLTSCERYWTQYLHTAVKLVIYYEGDTYHNVMDAIYGNVEAILEDYHKLSTKYDDYGINNVYAINADPTTTHELDPKLFDLIQFALDHQDEVDNLFNIALGPVLKVWHDARDACTVLFEDPVCEVPDIANLQAANAFTNPDDIILDEVNHTITMGPNMSIDLGGVSKGYISGKIIEYLDSLDISYLLNSGTSNISIGGTHPTRDNGQFLLAITDPTFALEYYATVYLSDGDQLVTSGDYQQYYEVDGKLYHHIINPNTLMPERYMRSVSIITSDPGLADLYSTAIFTMPIEDGLAFVNGIDNLEAIWYTLDNTVVLSEHFEANYLDTLYVDKD